MSARAGIEFNNQFHHLLSEGSENRRLCDMLDELRSEVMRLEIWAFSSFSKWEISIREHDEILDAVERGDYERALQTLEANRLMTYTDFVARMGPGHRDETATPRSPARDTETTVK